jgi:hypothetical protein
MKGRSIIDNVFLVSQSMEWALETKQPLVMLLLDYEKVYDRVEWGFLEGSLSSLGFVPTWIKWVKALYIDSWCAVGLNGQTNEPFKLSRSIRQGCPLAPFLYFFVSDCLGYMLDKEAGVKGLKLPGNLDEVIDQEYADDTNLYLEGSLENLNHTKVALETYALASGAQINWNKSQAIWIVPSPRPFEWGREVGLRWMIPGETTRYLGFYIGFQVSAERRFKEVLATLRKKLSYWCTTQLSLASRVLIANQVLLSSLWYGASCWSPHMCSIAKVTALIWNYIWLGEDGSRRCPAKVAWSSLILSKQAGGIKLIDPELQMKALLVKLFVRGLVPGTAPWKSLILHRIDTLSPKRGGQWPSNRHYLLFAYNTRRNGSELWQGLWKAWVDIRCGLKFQQPASTDEVSRQPIFWNGEILDSTGKMLGDAPYAFGCLWAKKHIFTIQNLWDTERNTWKRSIDLSHQLGLRISPERHEEVLTSIPSHWCMRGDPAFTLNEWVATTREDAVNVIYQLTSPHQGIAFKETQLGLFAPPTSDLTDITGMELYPVRVIATTSDFKDTRLNLKGEPPDSIWFMGITRHLPFDPGEWLWASTNAKVHFFNYTSKIGYQLGLSRKQQGSRLHEKLEALQLTDTEIKLATDLIWEDNKPAKLQFFAWQVASGGLFTGSPAIHLGFPGECKRCGSGLIETIEYCMSSRNHARKAWRWAQNIREALGLTKAMAWRELASGIKPGTRLHNGYQHH